MPSTLTFEELQEFINMGLCFEIDFYKKSINCSSTSYKTCEKCPIHVYQKAYTYNSTKGTTCFQTIMKLICYKPLLLFVVRWKN